MNQKKLAYLNPLFENEVKAERLKEASIRIYRHGKPVFENHYFGDKEDAIYRIFSMTKPITSTAVMMLYERGLLDLLDPVSKYIPAFKNMMVTTENGLVPAQTEVTLQQCLNMTSGMVYPSPDTVAGRYLTEVSDDIKKRVAAGEQISTLEWCKAIASSPLMFQPGERWRYSISADVLGGVVEAVAGMRYGEFLKKEIFEPLNMKDTGYYAQIPDKIGRLSTMYCRKNEKQELKPADSEMMTSFDCFTATGYTPFEGGGSGLCSTLEDYSHFALMLAGRGEYNGVRIVGRKTVDYMTTSQLNEVQRKGIYFDSCYGYTYSNLMRILDDKGAGVSNGSYGEFGWDGLPGNYFMIDPKEDLVLLYFQQIREGADVSLRRRMRQIVYGALE
ncbi:MAG: serine hydrolase domain-containing protein [Lachnospiraceae bacterium]